MATTTDWTPWMPLIGVVIGAVVTAFAGAGTTYWRERKFQKLKDAKDVAHLVALVAGALEHFSTDCEAVALDDGSYDDKGYLQVQTTPPVFEPDKLKVEWKSLPPELMFPILDLPYRVHEAERTIDGASDVTSPPDFDEFFEQRQYQYAVLGIETGLLAARLRQYAGVPARPGNPYWNSIDRMDSIRKGFERVWKQRAQVSVALPAQE